MFIHIKHSIPEDGVISVELKIDSVMGRDTYLTDVTEDFIPKLKRLISDCTIE